MNATKVSLGVDVYFYLFLTFLEDIFYPLVTLSLDQQIQYSLNKRLDCIRADLDILNKRRIFFLQRTESQNIQLVN
jgi:hypothetical protein